MDLQKDPTQTLLNDAEYGPKDFLDKRKDELNLQNKRAKQKLVFATCVSLFFIGIQTAGAIVSGSIAIFTDTAHLLSDIIGFAISIFCLLAAQRPATKVLSYGYHRAEVIGAMASVIIIWVLTIWLLVEAT